MAAIKYLVPYEVRVRAADTASGKPVSNVFYWRCGIQTVAPPAYGGVIAGTGSTATFLGNLVSRYTTTIENLLSDKYVLSAFEMRSLEGWRYNTPVVPITAVGVGVSTVITTTGIGSLVTGNWVSINGVTGATAANGIWQVTIVGPNSFSIPANTSTQVWGGGGNWQRATGAPGWLYGDFDYVSDSTAGGVATEAVALFATASVRRLAIITGRNFQGRNSFSPIPESQVASGGFTAGAKTSWATALTSFLAPLANGGTDVPGSGNMYLWNVSKTIAFGLVSPFTASGGWSAAVNTLELRPDMGSLTRRKPRLTTVITP